MKRYIFLFSVVFLLFFCCQVQALEDYVLHIGQDKTFTEYNKHDRLYGPWESLNMPFDWGIERDGYFVNTWSYNYPGQGGYALGSLGLALTRDYGDYTLEEVQNLPVRVVYDVTYDIVVDYYTGTSSNGVCHAFLYANPFSNGGDPMTPGVNVIDAVGPTAPQKEGGIHERNKIYTVTSLKGEPLTISNLPYLSVNVQSDCANNGDAIHSAAAALYVNRITVEFPLAAIIHSDVVSGQAPLKVQFKDASFGNPTSWLWDFDDGTTSTEPTPLHTYTKPGIYSVKLTVRNALESDTVDKPYLIVVKPSVTISGPPYLTLAKKPKDSPEATFTASVNPSGGGYSWAVIQGQEKLTGNPRNTNTFTVKAKSESGSPNDVVIKVVYTYNTHVNEAIYHLTVQRPDSLRIYSDPVVSPPYYYKGKFIGNKTTYQFQVMDQWGAYPIIPISTKDKSVTENMKLVYSNDPFALKNPRIDAASSHLNNVGVFVDTLAPFRDDKNPSRSAIPINVRTLIQQDISVYGWPMNTRCQIHSFSGAISQEGICPSS